MERDLFRCFVIGCLLFLPAGRTQAQSASGLGAEDAARLFAAARPYLEAVLGRRLESTPALRLATLEQIQRRRDADLEAHVRLRFPHLQGAERDRAVEVSQQVTAAALLTWHSEDGNVIFLRPQDLKTVAGWDASLSAVDTPSFLQLVLVQETVRLLLDRQLALPLQTAERDSEAFQALQAVREGRVQWVTRQVARRLGTQTLCPLLAELLLRVPDTAPGPALRAISQTALRQRYEGAVQGLAFFDRLEALGVRDAEKQVFARPPRDLRELRQPEQYVRAIQDARPGLQAVLSGLAGPEPAAAWQASEQPWSPAMLRQIAALLGLAERAEKVAATWSEGRSLVWTARANPGQQVALSVVRHEHAAGARAYFGFANDLQRKRDELSGAPCVGSLKVLEARCTAVSLPGVEEAVRFDKRIQFGTGSPVPASVVLARAGDLVIECSWHGLSADAAWTERVVTAVLSQAGKH
jgi:hypothetical protein